MGIGGLSAHSQGSHAPEPPNGPDVPSRWTVAPPCSCHICATHQELSQSVAVTHGHSTGPTSLYVSPHHAHEGTPIFQAGAVHGWPSSNAIGRRRISAHRGGCGGQGQSQGTDGLGRLAAWVSLSLNPQGHRAALVAVGLIRTGRASCAGSPSRTTRGALCGCIPRRRTKD